MKTSVIEDHIEKLPPKQKEAIRTCLKAGKAKAPSGHRYSIDWVYECMLLRIKGPKLYRKMQRDKLLPLPHVRTLQRYMKKLSPTYGFNENVLEMMRRKADSLPLAARHG